ncbi:hypothetical protein FDP41_009157 [Naegleria fowleri]|uniref:Right handed beta helix domain-containing protein n=1 Tax=Naegleria fowleri TaxID=5763 RepID=A0A6A5BCC8_NAEFO|nr:uncharacterized protein FDP41_009157 [Naegleria fowleri]KAF0972552.1 hypothetical protein FDP41_009157 [Naegleria fowleri]
MGEKSISSSISRTTSSSFNSLFMLSTLFLILLLLHSFFTPFFILSENLSFSSSTFPLQATTTTKSLSSSENSLINPLNFTILYVQPNSSSSSLPNCTQKSDPCSSISQALQKLSELFQLKIIEQKSAIIYLLEGKYVGNSAACRMKQNAVSESYDDIIVASYPYDNTNNSENRMIIDCNNGELISYLKARSISFQNLTVLRTKIYSDEQFVVLNVFEIKFEMCQIDNMAVQASYYKKEFNVTFVQCNVTHSELYNILKTTFEESIMKFIGLTSNKKAIVSIQNCAIQNFNYKSVQQYVNTILDIQYSQTFSIVNSQFVNSSFVITRFQSIEFKGVNFDGYTSIYQAYSRTATLTNIISTNGNFFLESDGIDSVVFSRCVFSQPQQEVDTNAIQNPKPTIRISSTYFLQVSATFKNLHTIPLSTSLVSNLVITGSLFENNKGAVIANFEGVLDSEIRLVTSSFSYNSLEQGFGGAVSISGVQRTVFEQCYFMGNKALNGGAMYLDTRFVSVQSADFINNYATQNGGALYIKNHDSSFFSNLGFTFLNNTAYRGGAIYFETSAPLDSQQSLLRKFHSCYNNTALYSGGCIYSTKIDMSDNYNIYLSNNIGNKALSYGPFIGGPSRISIFKL